MTPLQSLAAELGAIRKRHENSLKSPTVPGDLESAQRTEKILRSDRATLLARLAELEAERAETYATMNHAHIFIYTREKMHPDGRLLYEDLLRRLAPSPKPEE